MARVNPCDPRALLRQIAIPLLGQFFERRGELLELPWKELQAKKQTEPIYAAWQKLPERSRQEGQALMHEIVELASQRGMAVLAQEMSLTAADRAWELTSCRSRLNKAMWFYLNFPRQFDRVTLFARADSSVHGRYAIRRKDLPKTPVTVTDEVKTALANSLRDYFWPTQMRGHHCHIEHNTRSNGDEYFFAYLDDWPDRKLVFEDAGRLKVISARFAFPVLFVYSPREGVLDLMGVSDKSIYYPMQRAFCKSVLGIDVVPANPLRTVYRLQSVLDPSFDYPTAIEDNIARVQLLSIRLKPLGSIRNLRSNLQVFDAAITRSEWLDLIQRALSAYGVGPTQAVVEEAKFKITLLRNGLNRPRSTEIRVVLPSRCSLRNKSEEWQAIGLRCLNLWGMIDA